MRAHITKTDCVGCRDDFYNGKNNLGVKECRLFKGAVLVLRQRVPITQPPPHRQKPEMYPNCRRDPGHVFLPTKPVTTRDKIGPTLARLYK